MLMPFFRRWVPEWLSFSSPPIDGVGDPGGPLKATAAASIGGGNPDPDHPAEPAAAPAAAKGASKAAAAGAVPKVKKRLHLSLRK